MSKRYLLHFLFVIVIFCSHQAAGQNQSNFKTYKQNNLENYKIAGQIYNLWKAKDNWFSKSNDTISYFVDDRNYKGILNYGVTFRSKDYRNFNFAENLSMCFLKVEITKCNFNPKDNTLDVEGFVTGNGDWGANEFVRTKKKQDNIHIYLGEKTDTIKSCRLGSIVHVDSVEVKLKNKLIDQYTVLDKFPAFYFKRYSYTTIPLPGKHPFKISGKISKNTLLCFGSGACYSEIYNVGSMIYDGMQHKEMALEKAKTECRPILTNNKKLSDEKSKTSIQDLEYYICTQNAENYILARQYAKAKEEYNLLSTKYPVLFSRDIHNAVRCAILSRDLKAAFLWSEKLAHKGIDLPYFNAKVFNAIRKNPQWKSFSIRFDSISKDSKSKWNPALKKELKSLLNEDQNNYGLANRKNPKVLYETTQAVTPKLIDLLQREGYPSEEKIGVETENDTILIFAPDYNILIRHAIQQQPETLEILEKLLDKSGSTLEYDSKRNSNSVMPNNTCFHIYKGNLYSLKSCGRNELEIKKISFKFNNPYGFIMDYGNFIVSDYNEMNPKEWDDYYQENFNLIMKLTDDWKFYEK